MRIAILGPFSVIGGVSTVVEELALAFLRRGDEVTIVTLEPLAEKSTFPTKIKIVAPSSEAASINVATDPTIGRVIKNLLNRGYICQIISFLRSEKYDLAISNLYYSAFLSIINASQKVHILHGFGDFLSGTIRKTVADYSNIIGAKLSNTVIANSYLTAAINNTRFGINATVIPLGVSTSQNYTLTNESERDIDVLYVGRLIPHKSVSVILEAIAILSKKRAKQVNLHLCGEGSEMHRLQLLAQQLGIENRVVFHGYLPRQQLSQYYARASCLVSLNPTEPFGLIYLEALAYGVPVILCKGSGFSAFCDDRFSYLVDCLPNIVAEGIEQVLSNRWDRQWIMRHILETFNWNRTANAIVNAVETTEEI